jgi:hypothetical protein
MRVMGKGDEDKVCVWGDWEDVCLGCNRVIERVWVMNGY